MRGPFFYFLANSCYCPFFDHSHPREYKMYLIVNLGFLGGSVVKNPPANAGDTVLIPGLEDPLEKELATHSSILAWKIPRTEEPGWL